jgi:hypothetical protein
MTSSHPILHTIQPLHPVTPRWAITLKGAGIVQSSLQHTAPQNHTLQRIFRKFLFPRIFGIDCTNRHRLIICRGRGGWMLDASWPCSALRQFLLLCHTHQRQLTACGPRLQLRRHSHLPSTLSSCGLPAVACARGMMSSGWIPWRHRLPSRAAMEEAASTLRWRA